MSGDTKYIAFRGESRAVTRNKDGYYEDGFGTLYAFKDNSKSLDTVDRCGVGWFSLSPSSPLTPACAPHDYAYSSPVFQAFHARQEADFYLKHLVEQIPGHSSITPELFYLISRTLGSDLWENDKTND